MTFLMHQTIPSEGVAIGTINEENSLVPKSGVTRCGAAFLETLRHQQALAFTERLDHLPDIGVFQIAWETIRKMSEALSMDPANVENNFRFGLAFDMFRSEQVRHMLGGCCTNKRLFRLHGVNLGRRHSKRGSIFIMRQGFPA
jgi:hypothetical protein